MQRISLTLQWGPLGNTAAITADKLPDTCPRCHHAIKPTQLGGYVDLDHKKSYVTLVCPRRECDALFIAEYAETYDPLSPDRYHALRVLHPQTLETQMFSDNIANVSSDFIELYNQAYSAEQHGLDQICGAGYRKALEFLVKDYLINTKEMNKDQVAKTQLGNCITNEGWITDNRLRQSAQRATWLGNDETHYEKLHPDMTIDDLKTLINLAVHWIDGEEMMRKMLERLPDKKKDTPDKKVEEPREDQPIAAVTVTQDVNNQPAPNPV